MKIPKKFTDYPWVTAAVAVVLILVLLFGLTQILGDLADIFGADWIRGMIEGGIDIVPPE